MSDNCHNHKAHTPGHAPTAGVSYTCPMHPEIMQAEPGMCPECGMALIADESYKSKIKDHDSGRHATHGGHDKHEGHKTDSFLRKFWVSLALTIPVLIYADVFQSILQFGPLPKFPASDYLPLVLGTIVFFYGGFVFLLGAYKELRARLPGMMTLIGVAISAAYLWSVYAVFASLEPLFWELTTLITIMLLGHYIEMRAVKGARGALKELSKLLPDAAVVFREGKTVSVSLSDLRENDLVIVKPGGKIPADGIVEEGESDVNEAFVTGESKPVSKNNGSSVIAGTINGDGSLRVRVSAIGEKTFLAGVMKLVLEAERSKSRLQILSDRAAFYLTIVAIGGGFVTLLAWLIAGESASFAVSRLVAVLVITCPHALGLAVPLVASISTTKAAQNGFLVKRRIALEAARNIDTVLFDKTGTLTEGKFSVISASADEALRLAASVEAHSEHPIAAAVVSEARKRGLVFSSAKNFRRIPGIGAEAEVEGVKVFVGHRGEDDIKVESAGKLVGSIKVSDTIRPEAKEGLRALKQMGIKIAMITGDSKEVAESVANELGLDEFFARVLPGEKAAKVKYLQKRGAKVAMIGDGVNDAPALTEADLGVAVGAGTNVAIESAGIILMRNDPRDIPKIISLSRQTYKKMIQNLWWASGYNIAALPLAAGALAFKGVLLEPAVAAVLMSLSTVIVSLNALLLRRARL